MSSEDFDTEYTDDSICPWCGKEQQDTWEVDSDSTILDCDYCEKPFHFERMTNVTFSTKRLES
jgi:transcription elongation factor Elf1